MRPLNPAPVSARLLQSSSAQLRFSSSMPLDPYTPNEHAAQHPPPPPPLSPPQSVHLSAKPALPAWLQNHKPPPLSARNKHETHTSIFTQLFPTRESYRPQPPPPPITVTDADLEEAARQKSTHESWELPKPLLAGSAAVNAAAVAVTEKLDGGSASWKELREKFPALGVRKPIFKSRYWNLHQEHMAMLIIKNTLTGLVASDFERIVPPGLHVSATFWSILKVVPKRNPKTLEPTGTYYLLFATESNAIVYREELHRLHRLYSSRPFGSTAFGPDKQTLPFALASPNASKVSIEIAVGQNAILQRFRPGYKVNLFRRREYGIEPAGGRTDVAGADCLVQLILHGDQMTLGRLYMLLNEDERERGVPWGLVRRWRRNGVAFNLKDAHLAGYESNRKGGPLSVLHPSVTEADLYLKPAAAAASSSSTSSSSASAGDASESSEDTNHAAPDLGEAARARASTENPLYVGSSQFLLLFTSQLEAQRFVRTWHTRVVHFCNSQLRTTVFRARVVADVWQEDAVAATAAAAGIRRSAKKLPNEPVPGDQRRYQDYPWKNAGAGMGVGVGVGVGAQRQQIKPHKGVYTHYYKQKITM